MHRDGICLELRDLPCTTAQLASSTFVLWTTVETTLTQNSKHNGALRSKVVCFEFGRVQGLRHASAAGFGAPWARDCLRGQICNCFWLEFQKQKHLVCSHFARCSVLRCTWILYCRKQKLRRRFCVCFCRRASLQEVQSHGLIVHVNDDRHSCYCIHYPLLL